MRQHEATSHSTSGDVCAMAQCPSRFKHADEQHWTRCYSAAAHQAPLIHLAAPLHSRPQRERNQARHLFGTWVPSHLREQKRSCHIVSTMHKRVPGARLPFKVAKCTAL